MMGARRRTPASLLNRYARRANNLRPALRFARKVRGEFLARAAQPGEAGGGKDDPNKSALLSPTAPKPAGSAATR